MEPTWVGGTKVYSGGLGHMTKMAATPVYGRNIKKHLRNQRANDIGALYTALETWAQ